MMPPKTTKEHKSRLDFPHAARAVLRLVFMAVVLVECHAPAAWGDLKQNASQWIEKAGQLIPSTIDTLNKKSDSQAATEDSQTEDQRRRNDAFYKDLPVRDPFKPIALLAVLKEEQQKALAERAAAQRRTESETTQTPADDEEEVIPPPQATVQGLIWNTDRPQALVDHQIIRPGDTIQGWIVETIDSNGVHLRYDDRTHVLQPVMNVSSERSGP